MNSRSPGSSRVPRSGMVRQPVRGPEPEEDRVQEVATQKWPNGPPPTGPRAWISRGDGKSRTTASSSSPPLAFCEIASLKAESAFHQSGSKPGDVDVVRQDSGRVLSPTTTTVVDTESVEDVDLMQAGFEW